ncbi:MAG: NAD-dependent DNA ligase LigA [Acutalibacteraceae bacterium]
MNFEEAKSLAEKYKKEIEYHNKKYYEDDSPEIDDYEYDRMVKSLEELEKNFPELASEDSPTQHVGGRASEKFSPVIHEVKMESLHDSFSIAEIEAFYNKMKTVVGNVSCVVEPKIDGLSVSIEYVNGKLFRASTRGDGNVGEDVTENILTINSLPKKLNKNIEYLEVRGEVYMSKNSFLNLVQKQESEGKKTFKNPRNAAAGSLRQKDAHITESRNLDIFIFNIQKIVGYELNFHKESLDFLRGLGLPTLPFYTLCKNMDEISAEINRIGSIKSDLPFQTDGAVVKLDSFEHRKILGSTSKFPRWAEAYKYPPEEKSTELLDIEINVGRTGILTPTGVLNPIYISGSTVGRVVLHNKDFIQEKDIRIGDTVVIRKAGEIIPEIVKVISHRKNSKEYEFPRKCPSCGSEVAQVDDEVAIRCVNTNCPAQLLRNLIHFVSKGAMDIDGLGETLIANMVEQNIISSPVQLYELSTEKLMSMERMGEKSSQNIINSIEKSKNQNLDRLIFALGIRHVGQKAAKLLACKFENLDNLMNASKEKISEIDGIGEVIADSICCYFSVPQNIKLINALKSKGLNMNFIDNSQNSALKNKIFVLTGTLEKYTRGEATQIIESMGGKVTSSVSKNTSYVLCGDSPGSKAEKAQKLGIRIIDEDDFINMISH